MSKFRTIQNSSGNNRKGFSYSGDSAPRSDIDGFFALFNRIDWGETTKRLKNSRK
jgi:hypothetical protein